MGLSRLRVVVRLVNCFINGENEYVIEKDERAQKPTETKFTHSRKHIRIIDRPHHKHCVVNMSAQRE
jgi:hypothetical protein